MTNVTEQMASDIAMKLNGGEWSDGKWYSEGHRKAWTDAVRPYADKIERLLAALDHVSCMCLGQCLHGVKDRERCIRYQARSTLQQEDK